MSDRDLLSFLSDVQLKCGKDHSASDLVLHALSQLRRGEISRRYCVDLIKCALLPRPEMLQRFCAIVEEVPPANSRSGCVVKEAFVNTSIEFELWPGALGTFLAKSRQALLGQSTLEDLIVTVEHIREDTSGPFWLLWDLYKPILPNSLFMQAIYDGCVEQEMVPVSYVMPTTPSETDNDPAAAVPDTIIDSDLVCYYTSDCRNINRELGVLRHGSYGLIKRKEVNVRCSGRKPRDFAVLNDRWATAASGSEGQFQPAQKNQFEEKLFLMEDERITLDVQICRLRYSLQRFDALLDEIKSGRVVLDNATFPRGVLSSLDILSIKELYGVHLQTLFRKIVEQPLDVIPIVRNRIDEKISILTDARRNKESDYHDLNKKNYSRSLEVRHEEKQPILAGAPSSLIQELKFQFEINHQAALSTYDLIGRTAKLLNQKDSTTIPILDFILSELDLKDPPPISRQLSFTGYPSNTSINQHKDRTLLLSNEFVNLFQTFSKVSSIIEKVLTAQPPTQQFTGDVSDARGIQLAVAIGNVSASIFHPNFAQEAISESIPSFIVSGKHNPSLESLFEVPSQLPPGSLETLKKSVQMFIRGGQNAFLDDATQVIMDAPQCDDDKMYNAMVLEKLSGTTYYSAKITKVNDEKSIIDFQTHIQKLARTKQSLRLFFDPEFGPAVLNKSAHDEQQFRILTGRHSHTARAARRNTIGRRGLCDMKFRLTSNEIEFVPSTQAVILRK